MRKARCKQPFIADLLGDHAGLLVKVDRVFPAIRVIEGQSLKLRAAATLY